MTMENPTTPLSDPDDWLYEAFGAQPASSGVKVGRETALTYAAVWRAVDLIATAVAKLPLHVYQRTGEGKDRAVEHPAYAMLRYKPNRYMTAFTFRQTLQLHVLLHGNGYAYIDRDGAGRPLELLPLDPCATYPERRGGVLFYVTTIDGQDFVIPATDIVHIKGLGYDGLVGYSVLAKARETLGLGLAARTYGSKLFKNNGRPSAALEVPGKLKEPAKRLIRESWERQTASLDNAHRVALLEDGVKLHTYGMTADEAQFLQTREFEIREIANWFGVPPHKLGDPTRTAYASLEQENQSFLDDSLDGWFVRWEEELRDKVLSEAEKVVDSHSVEFLRNALVRANLTDRFNAYSVAILNRIMSPNEVRARENLNPYDGGDQFLVPLNMAVPSAGVEEEEDRSRQDRLTAAVRRMFFDAARRAIRRVALHARRAASDPRKFLGWLDTFAAEHHAVLTEMLAPAAESLAVIQGRTDARAEQAANALMAGVRDALLAASGRVGAADLLREVDATCAVLESRAAELATAWEEDGRAD